jgi:hypothetical protein
MFRPFGAILRGSTVKGTCFTIANDLSIIHFTERSLKIRFKGHIRIIKNNKEDPAFVTPVLNNKHQHGNMEDIRDVIDYAEKGKIVNIK